MADQLEDTSVFTHAKDTAAYCRKRIQAGLESLGRGTVFVMQPGALCDWQDKKYHKSICLDCPAWGNCSRILFPITKSMNLGADGSKYQIYLTSCLYSPGGVRITVIG